MPKIVKLLCRTPFGGAGDVVKVDDEAFEAYGVTMMEETEESETPIPDFTTPAPTVNREDGSDTNPVTTTNRAVRKTKTANVAGSDTNPVTTTPTTGTDSTPTDPVNTTTGTDTTPNTTENA